jgi:hypothetical protein
VGTKVLGLSSDVKNARHQIKAGVDLIVSQSAEMQIPQVVDSVIPTPVIAVCRTDDGRSIAAALALGAIGVWIDGTALFADLIGRAYYGNAPNRRRAAAMKAQNPVFEAMADLVNNAVGELTRLRAGIEVRP